MFDKFLEVCAALGMIAPLILLCMHKAKVRRSNKEIQQRWEGKNDANAQ